MQLTHDLWVQNPKSRNVTSDLFDVNENQHKINETFLPSFLESEGKHLEY